MARIPALTVLLAAAALNVVGCGGTVKRPDGGLGLLPVGAPAPEVVGVDPDNKQVTLSSYKGHPVVVYFYPQDATPGCTKEACAFRDSWKKFESAHVSVVGISTNSQERHRAFQASHHLPFPLVSDESGAAGYAFGVPRNVLGYSRVSFLLDKDGKVAHVWPDVDPGVHAEDVLKEAARLEASN